MIYILHHIKHTFFRYSFPKSIYLSTCLEFIHGEAGASRNVRNFYTIKQCVTINNRRPQIYSRRDNLVKKEENVWLHYRGIKTDECSQIFNSPRSTNLITNSFSFPRAWHFKKFLIKLQKVKQCFFFFFSRFLYQEYGRSLIRVSYYLIKRSLVILI